MLSFECNRPIKLESNKKPVTNEIQNYNLTNQQITWNSKKTYDSIANLIESNISSFRKDSIDLMDLELSTDGGVAIAFYSDTSSIQTIIANVAGESWNSKYNLHYLKNKLFLIREEYEEYNVPYYMDSAKAAENNSEAFDPSKSKITINNYYFENDKLVLKTNDDSIKSNDSLEIKEKESDLISIHRTIFPLLFTKIKEDARAEKTVGWVAAEFPRTLSRHYFA
jgi:hypothetical protein